MCVCVCGCCRYIYYDADSAPTKEDLERSEMQEARLREGMHACLFFSFYTGFELPSSLLSETEAKLFHHFHYSIVTFAFSPQMFFFFPVAAPVVVDRGRHPPQPHWLSCRIGGELSLVACLTLVLLLLPFPGFVRMRELLEMTRHEIVSTVHKCTSISDLPSNQINPERERERPGS